MVYAPGNGCTENKNIQERMVQHTMRKNRLITVMMTAALAATAFAGCGNNEVATGAKPAVTESKTSGTTEVASEKETEQAYDPDDNTYNHLMSDPYFDMDNAIKDEEAMEHRKLYNHDDREVLYNIMDGDRYMELTGAAVIEVNKTFDIEEVYNSEYGIGWLDLCGGEGVYSAFYKQLTYYGINQYSQMEFHLMDTTIAFVSGDGGKNVADCETVTVLKAYTIPLDPNQDGYPVFILEAFDCDRPVGLLCEVEADGEQGYMVLSDWFLSDYLGVDLSSVVDTDNE